MKLSKEDIQAIAQEMHNLNKADQNKQGASACANNTGAKVENDQPSQKRKKQEGAKNEATPKNLATVGLLLFWGVVFVVLLVKLWAYI